MESKVSVIIPIYNVEQYLAQCLDSVINQTYKNLEIICVNDCSPDNYAKILQEYALKDNRIKIVNREKNGGLSAARNSGLDVATGEYVYFIDSDDWIDLDYIAKMVDKIEEQNCDIVLNTNIIKDSDKKSEPFLWQRYTKKDKDGEFLDKVTAINDSQCMIWCHLYRRDFLIKNNLRFPEGYIHEDEYFQHITKNLSDNLFAFYGASYHYRQRQDSIMSARKNVIKSYVKIFNLIYDFYKNNNLLNIDNRIKLFRLDCIAAIENEYDFNLINMYVDKISKDFEQDRMASSDYEKYLYNKIKKSNSYEEYKKNIGKLEKLSYLTREKLKRSKCKKVSVIIPVYNVEKYLRKCLDSVCAQTLEDIEIICVNDCSPDDSIEILKEYASKDNRIKIIDFKENRGVAVARNEAIKIATGEYIGFVDSDDWIDLDFYEKLYKKAKEDNVDLVVGNHITVQNNQNSKLIDIVNKVKKNKIYFNGLFYLGLYKNEILKKYDIKFLENVIYGEDRLFPILAVYYANKVETVADTYYYYFKRDFSASSKYYNNKQALNDFLVSTNEIIKQFNLLNYNECTYKLFFQEYLEYIVGAYFNAPDNFKSLIRKIFDCWLDNIKYKDVLDDIELKMLIGIVQNNDTFEYQKYQKKQFIKHLRNNVMIRSDK